MRGCLFFFLKKCSADKVQILGPICPRPFPAHCVVSGHMATIWAIPGMSERCGWLIFWDLQVTFTPSAGDKGADSAGNLGLATVAERENEPLSPRYRRSLFRF